MVSGDQPRDSARPTRVSVRLHGSLLLAACVFPPQFIPERRWRSRAAGARKPPHKQLSLNRSLSICRDSASRGRLLTSGALSAAQDSAGRTLLPHAGGDGGCHSTPRRARMPPRVREPSSLPWLLRVPQPQPHWRLWPDKSLMGGMLGPVWGVEEWPWAPTTARQGQPLPPLLSGPESLLTLSYVPSEGKVLPVCEP